MRRLFESEVFDDLVQASRGDIRRVEQLDTVPLIVKDHASVPLYAVPDLVLVSSCHSVVVDGVRFEPPVPQLVDFKTSARLRMPQVVRQLALYGYYCREQLGIAPHERTGIYVGRVVDLSPSGTDDLFVTIGPREIDAAVADLRNVVGDMTSRPTDDDGVIAGRGVRRTATPARTCPTCALLEACELSDRDSSPD